jgi:hypothetical protein
MTSIWSSPAAGRAYLVQVEAYTTRLSYFIAIVIYYVSAELFSLTASLAMMPKWQLPSAWAFVARLI